VDFINVNPGIRRGVIQPYTITIGTDIFFLNHDTVSNRFFWCSPADDDQRRNVEKILKDYLTNK
jgi:hypothetical protein